MTFKEYLLKQGLTEEQVTAIIGGMSENKFYLASEEKLDERYAKLKSRKEELEGQLTTNQTELDALKKSAEGNEELTKQLEEYQAKLDEAEKASQEALLAKDKEYAIRLAIGEAKALDADIVLGQLDKDTIKVVDGKLQGFDEQLTNLKEGKPFLFQGEQKKDEDPAIVVPSGNPSGGNPDPSDPFAAKLAKYQ